MANRCRLTFLIISLAFFSVLFSLSKGSTPIPLYQLLFGDNGQFHTIIFKLRLPRTLTAFVSGGLLALAGSLMQLLLQNPLADPYVLGVSGGAALFTLLLMLVGVSEHWLIGGAWLGSLLTILLIFALARKHRWETQALLLSGIALACGFSACISFVLLISPDASLHSMLFWLSGDLNDARYPWLALAILCCSAIGCWLLAPALNMLGRGEKAARAVGVNSSKMMILLYLISSLCTAAAVTLAGCIGFIGLIIPHFTRMLSGYDHRITLPVSILLGGTLLTIADTWARTFFSPQQIPVGILMAMLGVPLFVWMLQK